MTVIFTVAPAGIVAPFEPETEFATVAVTWSPTALVFVQILEPAVVFNVVPAAIVPTAPPPLVPRSPPAFVVRVLPLRVVTGPGIGGGTSDARGSGVIGRRADLAGARLRTELVGAAVGAAVTG
ncbi:MAG TPA: hypothetical protein VII52_15725, partial [Gemmatimonadaceae bacterium]